MSENKFITYQKFIDLAEVKEFSDLLKEHNIEFLVEDESAGLDATFGNSAFNKEYRIKLKKEDFEKVNNLKLQIPENEIEAIGRDYYLFQFTDLELIELITQNDKWSTFDFLLAQRILKERGKEVNAEVLRTLRAERIEELSKPEKNQTVWIVVGYLTAFLGGLIGFFIGWHLLSYKKTLPNGNRVPGYSEKDQKHGLRILIIGIISVIVTTIRFIAFD